MNVNGIHRLIFTPVRTRLRDTRRVSEFASTYDALAPRYDAWSGAIMPDVRAGWARKIDLLLEDGERVVELGCGTGVPVAKWIAARYEYTGVDASTGMLAEARRHVPDATFVQADMETVAFDPGSLGAVIAFYSIIHVPRESHAALFASIASWLRPGGMFVASLHSRDHADDFEPDWLGAGPMRWTGFDRDANLAMIAAAGLEVTESEVVDQVEPDGSYIHPLWLAARKPHEGSEPA
jgi:SAM-dependent methyltransferase